MRKIHISFLLLAAVLLMQLPVFPAMAESNGIVYSQNFENGVNVYIMGNSGLSGSAIPITDTSVYERIEDKESNWCGRFFGGGGTWGRAGIRFEPAGISEGRLKLHFRFRPYDKTFAGGSFGAVIIGNCDAKFNMLTLVNVQNNGKISAGFGNNTKDNAAFLLKDSDGNAAIAKQDVWYTYDAVADLDTRSLEVTVTEDGTNEVYSLNLYNIKRRGGRDEWTYWPDVTNFKDIACLFPMDLDDIEISYMPLEATGLSFVTGSGSFSDIADLYTTQVAVKFNFPVSRIMPGAVIADGVDCGGGSLSEDGTEYIFTLPEGLAEGVEYSVTVDPNYIVPRDSWVRAGETAVFRFTPEGVWEWSEDFETDTTVYTFPTRGGAGAAITDLNKFSQGTEGGNRYGRFYAGGGTWERCGLEFDNNGISEGRMNVHFRFRPFEKTIASGSFGAVLIGNCDEKFNWLTLVSVQADGTLTAACANNTTYTLLNSDGAVAKASAGRWYTYDAVLDLDSHSMEVTVTEDGTNAVFALDLYNLKMRGGRDEWIYWPDATSLKDIGCLFPMDLDDIRLSYMPLSVVSTEFLNENGEAADFATESTAALRLNFSAAARGIDEKISMDGQPCEAELSADGRSCYIHLQSALAVDETHTLRIEKGIAPQNPRIPASERQMLSFTVSDRNRLFAENYEGEDSALFMPFYGAGVCKTVEQDGRRFGQISTNWGSAGYQFGAVTEGKIRVRFDFMFDSISRFGDAAYSYIRIGHENGNADGYINDPLTLICRQGSELRFAHLSANDTSYRLGTVDAGVWYSYDALLDLDTHTVSIKISTAEGTKSITKVIPVKVSSSTQNDRYIGWPADNIFDQMSFVCAVNVDNILVERVYGLPEVSGQGLALIKPDGTVETDFTAVNPAVNTMQIDFGTRMNPASVTRESLRVSSADGELEWTDGGFDAGGKVYTVKFDGLKSNTAYTVTICGSVENTDGGAMGEDKTIVFITGAGTLSGGIDSIRVNGAEVTAIAALEGTAQVKLTIPNASDRDATAVVYLTYYDKNNKILGISEQHTQAPSGKATEQTLSFSVSKPEGTAYARFLLWTCDDTPMQAHRELR